MEFSPDFIKSLMASAFFAGAVYAGIRADIKALHEKAETAVRSATRAHARIDSHLEKGK